jgi:hypothetical protein
MYIQDKVEEYADEVCVTKNPNISIYRICVKKEHFSSVLVVSHECSVLFSAIASSTGCVSQAN